MECQTEIGADYPNRTDDLPLTKHYAYVTPLRLSLHLEEARMCCATRESLLPFKRAKLISVARAQPLRPSAKPGRTKKPKFCRVLFCGLPMGQIEKLFA
jgi:hypothetical protein